ncbi:MAG: copper chaperone PCu(A)C [Hyphomonadaceae bacterium]|nr:copper chaperone PCu(A)C [Hyphomonadaceae bacterium]
MRIHTALAALALALAACSPSAPPESATTAEAPTAAALEIRDAWAAPSPGGVDVAAGYLTLVGGSADDTLVSASSPRAASVEIHEMTMDGGAMQMRAVTGGLAVTAGQTVTLAPGGMHLMFMGVTQPFTPGENIPVTLTFANSGERTIDLPVHPPGQTVQH